MLQHVIGRVGVAERIADPLAGDEAVVGASVRINPVARRVIAIHGGLIALSAPLFPLLGLSVAWETALPHVFFLGLLLSVWAWYVTSPRKRHKVVVAETLLATFLLVLFTNTGGLAQYAGVALGLPLVDPWLASADAVLGVHVPSLTAWTGAHPILRLVLVVSYFSLLPQFILPLIVLGLTYRDREALWEYTFHFHVCLAVTILGVALLPAACAFSYYGFSSLIDQTRFISHFEQLRAGTFREIRFDDIEGLISCPSFHTAGGMIVTWAFRHYRRWALALGVLNLLLIAATVLTGAHYGIDVLVTALLFVVSVALWRVWGRAGL